MILSCVRSSFDNKLNNDSEQSEQEILVWKINGVVSTLGRTGVGWMPPTRFFLNFSKTNNHLDMPYSVAVRISHFDTSLVRIGCCGYEL